MSPLYQNCADALDVLDDRIHAFGQFQEKQIKLTAQDLTDSVAIKHATMLAIRSLQDSFIGAGNTVRVNALKDFCQQNDFKLMHYTMPGAVAAQFTVKTPGFEIVVQSH